jgi:hypothetical protein
MERFRVDSFGVFDEFPKCKDPDRGLQIRVNKSVIPPVTCQRLDERASHIPGPGAFCSRIDCLLLPIVLTRGSVTLRGIDGALGV